LDFFTDDLWEFLLLAILLFLVFFEALLDLEKLFLSGTLVPEFETLG
jgi:hypothetical protein